MTTLHWLPQPVEFQQQMKALTAATDAAERMARLTALAQQRLGFVETVQVDNALRASGPEARSLLPSVRLAVLAAATIDHLLPAIRVAGLRRGIVIDTWAGGFGQYRQELFDPGSPLQGFAPEMILFSTSARETLSQTPLTASRAAADEIIASATVELRQLWIQARRRFNATVIQQTHLDVSEAVFGSLDRQIPGSPVQQVARQNEALAAAAAEEGVLLLDIAQQAARDGLGAWFDVGRWLQGRIEIAPQAAVIYGELVARVVAAQRGLSRKCLVMDLDNTLWGGVIGDAGMEGIVLGQGSAAGEAHLALQQYARSLQQRGILLAVCSKNEPVIAEAAFRDHPEMALRRGHISAFFANWSDKAQNLRNIAAQLNIGIDSLVFIDDNPVERARVRESLPQVAVPELPDDPADYVRCLASAGYFEAVCFTAEDSERVGQYQANQERDRLRGDTQSMEDFLRGLQMSVVWGPVTPLELPRVTQLLNKTNQFNTTTRRYSSEEVARLTAGSDNLLLHFRLLDRFGDNGLVSAIILSPDPRERGVMEVVNWVMSCRVFGRQLENETMNIAVELVRERGFESLRAGFIPTCRNGVITDLFRKLGFTPLDDATPAGTSCWHLRLADYVPGSTFISRQVSA